MLLLNLLAMSSRNSLLLPHQNHMCRYMFGSGTGNIDFRPPPILQHRNTSRTSRVHRHGCLNIPTPLLSSLLLTPPSLSVSSQLHTQVPTFLSDKTMILLCDNSRVLKNTIRKSLMISAWKRGLDQPKE